MAPAVNANFGRIPRESQGPGPYPPPKHPAVEFIREAAPKKPVEGTHLRTGRLDLPTPAAGICVHLLVRL